MSRDVVNFGGTRGQSIDPNLQNCIKFVLCIKESFDILFV